MMDRHRAGYITKSQIQAFYPQEEKRDAKIKSAILRNLLKNEEVQLDLLGFLSLVHYITQIGLVSQELY